MSDYGIKPEEFGTITKNVKDTKGVLFLCDISELSIDDYVDIYRASYK